MKKHKRIILFILSAFMLLGGSPAVQAAEASKEVSVTYIPSEESLKKFVLSVTVEGNGELWCDGKEIGRKAEYQLGMDEEKTFQINTSDKGNLVSIIYDGENVTDQLQPDGSLTIIRKAHDASLTVKYGEKQQGLKSVIPLTGDRPKGVLLVFLAAGLSGILLYTRKKIKKTCE